MSKKRAPALLAYFRARYRIALVFLFFALMYAFIIDLYSLPLAAVGYAFCVCLTLSLIIVACDYAAFIKKRAILARLEDEGVLDAEQLPPAGNDIERGYREIVERLLDEQKRAREAHAAQVGSLTNYYAVWAHQIKTPIAAMRLMLQGEETPPPNELKGELMSIEHYVDMAMGYLRLGSDTTDFVIHTCDLDEIVRAAVKKFSHTFIRKRLSLRYEPLNTKVVTDKKWLGFMIEQLLSNALKYTNVGGIAIDMNEGALIIADTGIGIAPEDLPRVFEMGYTGVNGRVDSRASGIGLYLCKRIAHMLRHDLSIESSPGKGTRVRLTLTEPREWKE